MQFQVTPSRAKQGRGRYCSKECKYKYRVRPSGLKYNVVKENPTSFKPGETPWNKGVALKEEISYKELHRWVARHRDKAGVCEHCQEPKTTEWANKSDVRGAATRKYGKDKVQNG
jgi:hypothetical protein